MTAKQTPELPTAVIQARDRTGLADRFHGPSSGTGAYLDDTFNQGPLDMSSNVLPPDQELRSVLNTEDIAGKDAMLIKHQFAEYYARGINILRPEIVMASEFVPIIKSKNELPGLQVQLGEAKVSVNQVVRLIELHNAVQKSLNVASRDFINSAADCNVGELF